MDEDDVLVGLRFEVSGGLGRMSGRVVGKAGPLYLVQKEGAAHLELLELDDLRSAKFYREAAAELTGAPQPVADAAPIEFASTDSATNDPPRRRLADQIRKHLGSGT